MKAQDRILAAHDLETSGAEAVLRAHELARDAGARLVVCHAIPMLGRSNPLFPQRNSQAAEALSTVQDAAMQALGVAVTQLTGLGPGQFDLEIVEGDAGAAIVQRAESLGVSLVVVGGRPHVGLNGWLLGSVAERVVRHAHCPVLVARPQRHTKRVLVATDFSDPSLPAIQAAAAESRRIGGTLAIVHCIEYSEALPSSSMSLWTRPVGREDQELRESVRRQLEEALRHCGAAGETIVREGAVAPGIFLTADHLAADLIVVGTRGRTGLARLLLGSTAERVIRCAPISVLAVRLHSGA